MKLKKLIEPETVTIYRNGNCYGKFNETEFLYLRTQIKKNKLGGFYFYYEGEKIRIRKDGFMSKKTSLFTINLRLLDYILGFSDEIPNI